MIPISLESIKTLAQKMNFVSFDTLELETQSVKSHWYRHEDGLDVYYFQKDNGQLIKIHISILGQVIEWNPLDGTRTGLLVEREHDGEVFESVHYDARANLASIQQSLLILENATCLSSELRKELIKILDHTEASKKQSANFFARIFSLWRKSA
jgi:hypothetical protein